jgi:hypothetical protein
VIAVTRSLRPAGDRACDRDVFEGIQRGAQVDVLEDESIRGSKPEIVVAQARSARQDIVIATTNTLLFTPSIELNAA